MAKPIQTNVLKGAILSPCRSYRYELTRTWDPALAVVVFVMFNPSTADASIDDATIRKCMGFAKAWGYGGIRVVNLFAVRSSEPEVVFNYMDPIGPHNDNHIRDAVTDAVKVVVAWGCESTLRKRVKGESIANRVPAVLDLIREERPDLEILCLGKSKKGTPYHPLMLAYTTPLIPFEVAA